MTGPSGTDEASRDMPRGEERPYSNRLHRTLVPGKAVLLHRFLPGEKSINLLILGLIFLN